MNIIIVFKSTSSRCNSVYKNGRIIISVTSRRRNGIIYLEAHYIIRVMDYARVEAGSVLMSETVVKRAETAIMRMNIIWTYTLSLTATTVTRSHNIRAHCHRATTTTDTSKKQLRKLWAMAAAVWVLAIIFMGKIRHVYTITRSVSLPLPLDHRSLLTSHLLRKCSCLIITTMAEGGDNFPPD